MPSLSKLTVMAALAGTVAAALFAAPAAEAGSSTGSWRDCRPYCNGSGGYQRDGLYRGRDGVYGGGYYGGRGYRNSGRDGLYDGRDFRYSGRDGLYDGRDFRYGRDYRPRHRRYWGY